MIEKIIKIRDKFYTKYISVKLGSVGSNFHVQKGLALYNPKGISIGDNVSIQRYCTLKAVNTLKLGNNISIGQFCILDADLEIGNNVVISSYTHIISSDHDYKENLFGAGENKPIKIRNNVWLASGVKVLKGVTIGNNVVI